jgi:ATP-dependent Lhr-like helicase
VGREVKIVDAGLRKNLDLQVINPVEMFGPLPERSVWPSIHRLLLKEIQEHRSSIIFANNRRTTERLTNILNEMAEEENDPPTPLVRAHHGSLSLDVRREVEQALKDGRLRAVVATASLELGIDMGAVELVCQVESSGNIARGLQRVGRAGHLVGQQSKGRLIPKTLPDLLEQAVLAREMAAGQVEWLKVPVNCLDVLAQQIVAMVSMESCSVPEVLALVRRAYPYRDLTPAALESVLEMLSGRFPSEAFRDLKPRISWDRVHNRLHALPGSKQLALVNGGTIPDTGQYVAYIEGANTRVGELDEEFVYERRLGDVFLFGTTAWRIVNIGDDRVQVEKAEGVPAVLPFWRGEKVARSPDLGRAMGSFLREVAQRWQQGQSGEAMTAWVQEQCHTDVNAAQNLLFHVRRQIENAGAVPTDKILIVEAFRDQTGDWHLAFLSPLGSRFHLALRFALEARWRQRFGYRPHCLHQDDGLLVKIIDMDEPPLDIIDDLTPENLEDLILSELTDSAVFAIRFRHNAARALMLPRTKPDQRTPLWLQRLRARSLLQICRQQPDFPVVLETVRECLHEHLAVEQLQEFLAGLRTGDTQIVKRRAETPSPFAAQLLFSFTFNFMYEYDRVDSDRAPSRLDRSLLDQITKPEEHPHLLDPRAVAQVDRRLRGVGHLPRTKEEMAQWLRTLGDLAPMEVPPLQTEFLAELQQEGRTCRIGLPGVAEPERWVLTEQVGEYVAAFHLSTADVPGYQPGATDPATAALAILRRFLLTHALVGLNDILQRYPFDRSWAESQLQDWAREGQAIRLHSEAGESWSVPTNLEQVQRTSLSLLRREVPTVPPQQFARFLLYWQQAHPAAQQEGIEGLGLVLDKLRGWPLAQDLWEETILPLRVKHFHPRLLEELTSGGEWTWAVQQAKDEGMALTAFLRRDDLGNFPTPPPQTWPLETETVLHQLREKGAAFVVDLARTTGLPPNQVRASLWQLTRAGLVTNDRYEVLRRGEEADVIPDPVSRGGRTSLRNLRRSRVQHPEGRWSLIPWGHPDTDSIALHQAALLLDRYGIVAREMAQLDPWLLPWRALYEVLSRWELAGEVRRGYFVEGLSGAQFALPEAMQQLTSLAASDGSTEPVLLVNSCDPANLYGAGAPLGWGSKVAQAPAMTRRPSNWIALRGGQIILLIEQQGKRLTPWPGTPRQDTLAALRGLGDLLKTSQGKDWKGKITVEEWNGQPVMNTDGQELLLAAGFVRDYQAMTLYGAWSS